jgi:hypothetical protein
MADTSEWARSHDRPDRLSVCCLTADPPAMVAASLALFRDVADEIVVAVDSRVAPERLGPLLDVADTVARFEYTDPPERSRPWLFSLCRGDVVLSVDGDEVPSAALLAALPALAGDRGVAQTRIARRWCFPDEHSWLAERPWWPDFQRRLVRRGPMLDFDVGVHGGVRAAWPLRYAEESVYHLVCVLRGLAERRRRAREYDALRPGMVAVGGGPMNDTLYVPEHFATRRPVPTPDEDVVALRAVIAAEERTTRGVPDLPVVTAAEIAEHVPDDPMSPQGYRAKLRIVEPDLRTDPGNDTLLVAEISNIGDAPIPCRDMVGVQMRVGARVLDHNPVGRSGGWILVPLPSDIPAGATRLVEVHVPVPDEPGRYIVEVDLVNERGAWFGCATRFELAVTTRWGRFTS